MQKLFAGSLDILDVDEEKTVNIDKYRTDV